MKPIHACLILLTWGAASGQPAAVAPHFEVASVKRAEGGGPPGDIPRNMDNSPGHFAMHNVPMRYALEWAYDLKDYEISGPDWIKFEDRYDIVAKAAGPASEEQTRQMLQTLLTERFQMKLHREKKDLSVYVLVPGKGAAKVKEAAGDGPSITSGPNGATFHKFPISRLTFLLTRRLDRPVLDLTGLTGTYDYTIDLSGLNNAVIKEGEETTGPSIFTAVQRDLGLKLESRKHAIEILVLDSLNKAPTEN
ncbi:MAG TPA: TIGR03435 family protein [Bryobacteraceae bacterium]|jgi:uncharacterized protein (TIGR03435 family)|nr:TIGR03435 family protein [Bryobacteraceae bacterium]